MSKAQELAAKLLELARRGESGERDNAQRLLDELLKKHKLKLSDIESDEVDYRKVKVPKEQFWLFGQVVSTLGLISYSYASTVNKERYINCTKAQWMEAVAKFEHYSKLYQEEKDLFNEAFIFKNSLYPHESLSTGLAPIDKERSKRILSMARGIKEKGFQKRLDQ